MSVDDIDAVIATIEEQVRNHLQSLLSDPNQGKIEYVKKEDWGTRLMNARRDDVMIAEDKKKNIENEYEVIPLKGNNSAGFLFICTMDSLSNSCFGSALRCIIKTFGGKFDYVMFTIRPCDDIFLKLSIFVKGDVNILDFIETIG